MKKRKLTEIQLPKNVTYKLPLPEKYSQTTTLTFIDSVYGEFTSNLYNLLRSGKSLHPEAKYKRQLESVDKIAENKSNISKRQATMLAKYGKSHALQIPEFYAKSVAETRKNYGVDKPLQNKDCLHRMQEKFKAKTGVENPAQIPENCYILPNGKNITAYAEELGINKTTFLNQAKLGINLQDIQTRMENHTPYSNSTLEVYTESLLSSIGFTRCNKKMLQNYYYRPDFVHSTKKIAIDVDGLFVHSLKDSKYHSDKRKAYESEGWRLLQFRQDELYSKSSIILSIVSNLVNSNTTIIAARKCQIVVPSLQQVREFLTSYHLMGYCSAKYIGLEYEGSIVYLIGYKRFKTGVDIIRSCPKLSTRVMGGLSKLLAYINAVENPEYIQSWVDLRYGNGSSLEACGFTKSSEHVSWKWTDGHITLNRLQCKASIGKSQKQNAEERGLRKIYDAGQRLYKRKGREINPAHKQSTVEVDRSLVSDTSEQQLTARSLTEK